MKKLLFILFTITLLTSCEAPYYWNDYYGTHYCNIHNNYKIFCQRCGCEYCNWCYMCGCPCCYSYRYPYYEKENTLSDSLSTDTINFLNK